jgi:hypothetical protein
MSLTFEFPEDFEPEEISSLRNEDSEKVMYWIYSKQGKCKKYQDASSEEIYNWAKELFPDYKIEKDSQFGLQVVKSWVLDNAISVAQVYSKYLLGDQRFWKSLPEMRAVNNIKEEEEKNDEN